MTGETIPGEGITDVQPERILKELEALWVSLSKADSEKKNAVLRACSMTLLVVLEQQEDSQAVGEALAELIHESPSRAIVLRIDPNEGEQLEARVLAQCWMPFGRRQQICCEQIEISASISRLEEIPHIVTGLTVADLPVVLWCGSARLYSDSRFAHLLPLVDKLIVDTSTFARPEDGIAFIRNMRAQRLVADLTWTRLTPWREMIAVLFDEPKRRDLLSKVSHVTIRHTGPVAPVAMRYMAGWLRASLRTPARIRLESAAEATILFSGPGIDASIRVKDGWAELAVNGCTDHAAFPERSTWRCLREETQILGRDAVFENSVRMSVEQEVYPTPAGAAEACAKRIEAILSKRLQDAPHASIAVSGGSTPKLLFEALRSARLDWKRIHWFWVDERAVPPEDRDSNYALAAAAILTPAGIPASNIHRIRGEDPPERAALDYATELRGFFQIKAGEMPEFDVIHLGMGDEGHTASLFPGEPLIEDRENLTAVVSTPKPPHVRITLLPGVILAARHIVMLVAGADKSWALKSVFGNRRNPMHWPAQMVADGARDVRWFVDEKAASGLG
jgi:6-phosphogluconolactonase